MRTPLHSLIGNTRPSLLVAVGTHVYTKMLKKQLGCKSYAYQLEMATLGLRNVSTVPSSVQISTSEYTLFQWFRTHLASSRASDIVWPESSVVSRLPSFRTQGRVIDSMGIRFSFLMVRRAPSFGHSHVSLPQRRLRYRYTSRGKTWSSLTEGRNNIVESVVPIIHATHMETFG